MHLIQLDENNTVINIVPAVHAPLLTPLSDRYLLVMVPPVMGQVFDPEIKTFAAPPRRRWITNLAFDNRFSVDERVTIELAAMVEPGMTVEQKRQAMSLQVELGRAKKATYVDLGRADTRAGVQQFETFGLLAAGRALEILDAEIAAHEYFPDA